MSLTLDELRRAQKLDAVALAGIIAQAYPPVHRVAHTLAGNTKIARRVLRFVMRRGLRAIPTWRDEAAPQRWFLHHTILASRRAARKPPAPLNDLLVMSAQDQPAYVAFVRALRTLPVQQREALVLHHAEHLAMRQVATAMDCSTEAAEAHLSAAIAALRHVAGGDFDRFVRQLESAHHRLSPRGDLILPAIHQRVRRHVWPRKLWKFVYPLLSMGLLAAAVWGVWKILRLIDV